MERAGGTHRRYLLQYGHLLRGRHVLRTSSWFHRLVLQFEVWHRGSDYALFSGEGYMDFPETHGNEITLSIVEPMVDNWGSPSFSAASLSEPHRQYGSVREYLESLWELKIRVTVHDEMTGRRAVL
eukprot:54769-Eustigmatos_ZCMA.PRE.1